MSSDGGQLAGGEQGLQAAALADADVVDRREHEDDADRDDADAGDRRAARSSRVAREHHRDRRDDAGVHAPEHRPAPEKTEPAGESSRAGRRRRRRCAGRPRRARRR